MSNPPDVNSAFLNEPPNRPISVYDNLNSAMPPSSTNFQKKDDKKTNSRDLPFCNISFKFDNDENEISKSFKLADFMDAHHQDSLNNHSTREKNGQQFHSISKNGKSNQDTSQYLDGTDSESQNTVIDKPVISDAKSKFFGLKGDSMDSSECTKLIDSTEIDNFVVTRAQPNHHNNSINSAIYRGNLDQTEPSALHSAVDDKYSDGNESNSNRSTKCYPHEADINVNHNPSQVNVVYMSTTVPQNIKGSNIAGRHTPTRNSLRHSRMLVINKNYQEHKAPNPLGLRHPKIAKFLLILQIILGVIITTIGMWILLWAPNTRIQDNPYWSGLSLTLAGIVGLIVIRFRRIKRQKLKESCFNFLRVDSYILAILAIIFCLIASTFAAIHLSKLLAETTKCTSTNILIANAACICIFGLNANSTMSVLTEIKEDNRHTGENEFQYRDLSCGEVTGAWKYILLVSAILNFVGFLVSLAYLTIVFRKKNTKANYSTVTSDPF